MSAEEKRRAVGRRLDRRVEIAEVVFLDRDAEIANVPRDESCDSVLGARGRRNRGQLEEKLGDAAHAVATRSPDRVRARSRAAPTKPRKSGAARVGRDLNSGWNWLATNHGWSGSSMISTSRPSWNVPLTM